MINLKKSSGKMLAFFGVVGFSLVAGMAEQPPAASGAAQIDPSEHLFKLGMKFQPAATCSNTKCHGAPADAPAGADYINPSFTLWNADGTVDAPADPHRNSFKTLRNPQSATIAKAMGIATATTAQTCLACHAIAPPENLRDQAYQIAEGVSCNGCHGPSGASLANAASKGWNETHKEKGWTAKQRTAFAGKHGDMLKATGMYDTRPLVERSQQCVSCHLAISPQMIAAGHPQPTFEMNWYSTIYANRHWNDPADKYFGAKLWAAGQAAALEAALRQFGERADPRSGAAAKDVTAAYDQAQSHYMIFSPVFSAGGVAGDMNTVAGQLAEAQKALADPAKRAEVTKAALAAADAAHGLNAAIEKWQPTKDQVMKVLTAQLGQAGMVDLGGFGIEQQRTGIFALYNAYAGSADAPADAGDTRDFVGQTLFPLDDKGVPLSPFKVTPAQHKEAVAAVKAKLKM